MVVILLHMLRESSGRLSEPGFEGMMGVDFGGKADDEGFGCLASSWAELVLTG